MDRDIVDNFTGFLARLSSGRIIREIPVQGATNWPEVPKSYVSVLEFWWHGKLKVSLDASALPKGSTLFYCHTAYMDSRNLGTSHLLSRSIGYVNPKGKRFISVINEATGEVHSG